MWVEGVFDGLVQLRLDGLPEFIGSESPGDAHALGGGEAEVVPVLPRPGAIVLARVSDVPRRVLRVVAFAELHEVVGLDRALEAEFLGPQAVPGAFGFRGLGVVGGRGEREVVAGMPRGERSDGQHGSETPRELPR
jgi:hypothetical protein